MLNSLEKLQQSPRHVVRWQKAQQELLNGQPDVALDIYHDLLKRFPGVAGLWFELGLAAAKQLDFDQADRAFQRTAELAPKDVSMLILLGQQYHQLRRLDKARTCFERAAAADASSIPAQLSLADWFERERRLEDAWACVESCAARHPQNAEVLCVKALLLHRQGRNTEAERLLRDLLKTGLQNLHVAYAIRHQLAIVLDALGQYAEAMQQLHEAKTLLRRTADVAKMERDYDRADQRRRELLAALTPETIRHWRREGSGSPAGHRLAFLGGHPRSGTTLLEQILGAHPAIAAFDEPPAFVQEILEKLAPLNTASPLKVNALNTLTAARRTDYQQRYLKSLLRENAARPEAEVLLDKNPSPTASLHLWLRLFPDLKVLIALRDPRDVIVSCFFQKQILNATNANFLSLERTAKHFADLMDVWLRLRGLDGFDWLESRYEKVVTHLESEGRRVTEFLGLSWHERQANYHEAARNKFVFAPTYDDVTRPVHSRAVGRWQHYVEALAPIEQRLAPYRRAFGYS
ncbi:MAG TPA: sulfotransferase [Candidatus Acidoferrales bacterium]|nr:sulfotransferase [Candidatus Acidoferrales bacterium]